MLIEISGKNFGCFRDEFRLSMLATDIDPDDPRGVVEVVLEGDDEPLRVLRAAAIYGPNASGKTTVIRAAEALYFVIAMTSGLHPEAGVPVYEPFRLQSAPPSPVELGARAVIDGRVHDYSVSFNAEGFLTERLLQLKPDQGDATTLFDRRGKDVEGEWTAHPQFSLITKGFRPNTALLAIADVLAPEVMGDLAARLRNLFGQLDATAMRSLALRSKTARRTHDDQAFKAWLENLLGAADLGIVGVQASAKQRASQRDDPTLFGLDPDDEERPGRSEGLAINYTLQLLHRSSNAAEAIPYQRESHGTRRTVELAPLLYDLLNTKRPHAVFVDELDNAIHPTLFAWLVEEFNARFPASSQSQMVFTAHETILFDGEARSAVLRRDQIFFTEKGKDGAARLYSLADFQERQNVNLRRRYLQGRYGALPLTGSL